MTGCMAFYFCWLSMICTLRALTSQRSAIVSQRLVFLKREGCQHHRTSFVFQERDFFRFPKHTEMTPKKCIDALLCYHGGPQLIGPNIVSKNGQIYRFLCIP